MNYYIKIFNKKAHWIDHKMDKWIYARCSNCTVVQDVKSDYCPRCGAKMINSK